MGYFLGVAAGANAFVVIELLLSWAVSPAEPAVLRSAAAPVGVAITSATVLLSIWVIVAWWVAFPPFLLVRIVARRLNIRCVGYYLGGGALSGALLGALYEKIGESFRAGEPLGTDEPSEGATLAIFCLAGAIGALVFWWIAVRPDRGSDRFTA
ncbi:MAG TPA: hypothetical protein VGG57_06370 [Stellaceae bacterium]